MEMVMGGMSLVSASQGYDVPSGINPMTQLHHDEMVLPQDLANNVRNMTGGGGMTVNIHATDAQSVAKLFANNGAALGQALKAQMRNFAQ
jgi:hypothetical protein